LKETLELLKDLGIFTIIGGLIAFIIRSFINKYFDKRVKEFELELSNKAELYKAELEKESQKYKSELDIHLTKASRFHEKRLETISELYNKVVDLKQNLANLTSTLIFSTGDKQKDDEEKKQRKIDARKSYIEFRIYYDKKRIFIPEKTCELIDKLKDESFSALSDFNMREEFYGNRTTEFSVQLLKEINDRTSKTIPKILTELEFDFRKDIDVENR